jgi:hypothetical protein
MDAGAGGEIELACELYALEPPWLAVCPWEGYVGDCRGGGGGGLDRYEREGCSSYMISPDAG